MDKRTTNIIIIVALALICVCLPLCLGILGMVTSVQTVQAQDQPRLILTNLPADQPVGDLSALLTPDGALELPPGATGSYSVDGWRMALDEQGAPRFFPPAAPADHPDDPFWSRSFMLGVENMENLSASNVFALAVMDGGKVFVGGDFTAAGGVAVAHIACWDSATNTWQALGEGVDGAVRALAVQGAFLYVGGNFSQAGGIPSGALARWDDASQSWSAPGSLALDGGTPAVYAIATSAGGDVYIGGSFTAVDGLAVHNLARLDGSGWHDVGGGVIAATPQAASVYALELGAGGALYAGGAFSTAGGSPASNIALWDGAWHPVGGGVGGLNARVNAIVSRVDNTLFVGGYFSEAYDGLGGTLYANNIARWNGAAWSDLEGGVNSNVNALYDLGTALTTSAIVVYALAQQDPSAPLLAEAVRYLMSSRRGNGAWGSTYETAWVLLAMTRYLRDFITVCATFALAVLAMWMLREVVVAIALALR